MSSTPYLNIGGIFKYEIDRITIPSRKFLIWDSPCAVMKYVMKYCLERIENNIFYLTLIPAGRHSIFLSPWEKYIFNLFKSFFFRILVILGIKIVSDVDFLQFGCVSVLYIYALFPHFTSLFKHDINIFATFFALLIYLIIYISENYKFRLI